MLWHNMSLSPDVQGVYVFTSGVPDQMAEVVSSYIEEASSGRGVKLHSILFNVDDYDSNGAIPGRYANITRYVFLIYILIDIFGF